MHYYKSFENFEFDESFANVAISSEDGPLKELEVMPTRKA